MTLKVVQVSCVIDAEGRGPEALLHAWPTLPAVAAAAARAGADVTVMQASRVQAEFRRDGVSYQFVREPGRTRSGAGLLPARLAEAVHRAAPDVVHFNGLEFPLHARAVCAVGAPMLIQDHASHAGGRKRHLRRWGHARVAAAAFTSSAQATPFLGTGELPIVPIFAIPESSSWFSPGSRDEARGETGVFGDPALLWVGHLSENKDPITILRAVRLALERLPDLHLWCAFIGTALLDEVEQLLASDPLLAAHVHLLGHVPHQRVEMLCRACDMLVSGSHREGSGYALIEALACGLTPVVSDIPSFGALTGEGAIGALAPAGDARAFADAIVEQAGGCREDSRRRVRAHFERHLSFDKVGAQLVSAYASILERKRRA